MIWFIKTNSIVFYFYSLLVLGVLIFSDYVAFSMLLQFYNVYIILLSIALFSGMGALFALNTIISLIQKLKKNAPRSHFQYPLFVQIVITIIAGTLMTLPGILTSILGWLVYFKPFRMMIVRILYKLKPKFFIKQYSYFLAEYL